MSHIGFQTPVYQPADRSKSDLNAANTEFIFPTVPESLNLSSKNLPTNNQSDSFDDLESRFNKLKKT